MIVWKKGALFRTFAVKIDFEKIAALCEIVQWLIKVFWLKLGFSHIKKLIQTFSLQSHRFCDKTQNR